MCRCCQDCLRPLSRTNGDGEPQVSLPTFARARGLWGGPLPEAIAALTSLERRILRLGRVHSNVERVSLKSHMWAKGHTDALPAFVSRSSYVFAQNPDTFSRSLCLLPKDLVTEFAVQLVGTEGQKVTAEILRRMPHMMVSVHRLRAGIHWYSTHSWPWMLATKDSDYEDLHRQGARFEELLKTWEAELDARSEDVPRVLREYAASAMEKTTPVFNAGPVDANASAQTVPAVLRTQCEAMYFITSSCQLRYLVQGQLLFQRAMISHGDLHRWGDAFVKEVLNNGRWNRLWNFIFQGLGDVM